MIDTINIERNRKNKQSYIKKHNDGKNFLIIILIIILIIGVLGIFFYIKKRRKKQNLDSLLKLKDSKDYF